MERLKQLQRALDTAEAGLEAAVQRLSALKVRRGKSQQLAAGMQVLLD